MMGLIRSESTLPARGFTLVEIAIVLVIVGLLLAGVSSQFGAYADNDRYSATQDYLDDARKALLDYAGVNGFLPCPDTDNDGIANTGTPACASAEGTLPYVELGLRALTEWEAPLRYAVHQKAASGLTADACDVLGQQEPACFFDSRSFNLATDVSVAGNLAVDDAAGAGGNAVAQNLLAVLVSYGSNSLATQASCAAGGRSDDEDENCDGDTDFVLTTPRTAEADDPFDDQLVWLSEFDVKEARLYADSPVSSPVSQNPFLDQVTDQDANYPDPDNIPTSCPADSVSCQNGANGGDSVTGSADDDLLLGGNGKDTLSGADGDDIIYGGNGEDILHGGKGDDLLVGGKGNDTLNGGDGHDWLLGSEGNDTLHGNSGDDILLGGDNNDTLYGGDGVDFLFGGLNNDTLYGGAGVDFLFGSSNNDRLYGGAGADILSGESGNDYIVYNADETGDAADLIDGGADTDWLWVEGSLGKIEFEQAGVRTEVTGHHSLDGSKPGILYVDGKKWADFENMENIQRGAP